MLSDARREDALAVEAIEMHRLDACQLGDRRHVLGSSCDLWRCLDDAMFVARPTARARARSDEERSLPLQ